MGFAEQIAILTNAVNALIAIVKGQTTKWNDAVNAQIARLESWKDNVKRTQTMLIKKDEYSTILKMTNSRLATTYRLVISGTIGNFVISNIFDISVSHPYNIDVNQIVKGNYGRISIRVVNTASGDGTVELKRLNGLEGDAPLYITVIPYCGTVEHFDGDAADSSAESGNAVFEQEFI